MKRAFRRLFRRHRTTTTDLTVTLRIDTTDFNAALRSVHVALDDLAARMPERRH